MTVFFKSIKKPKEQKKGTCDSFYFNTKKIGIFSLKKAFATECTNKNYFGFECLHSVIYYTIKSILYGSKIHVPSQL